MYAFAAIYLPIAGILQIITAWLAYAPVTRAVYAHIKAPGASAVSVLISNLPFVKECFIIKEAYLGWHWNLWLASAVFIGTVLLQFFLIHLAIKNLRSVERF